MVLQTRETRAAGTRFLPVRLIVVGAIVCGMCLGWGSLARTLAAQAGLTIWSGVYTEAQAKRGKEISDKKCATCHEANLEGGQGGSALTGPEVLGRWGAGTLAELFETNRTTMPPEDVMSLSQQQTADLVAFELQMNGCKPGDKELPTDLAALKQIRITTSADAK
jgi:S-disulfanyl-L-cysteine oxidoreductase SoxD